VIVLKAHDALGVPLPVEPVSTAVDGIDEVVLARDRLAGAARVAGRADGGVAELVLAERVASRAGQHSPAVHPPPQQTSAALAAQVVLSAAAHVPETHAPALPPASCR
jgi:hypothetical protein